MALNALILAVAVVVNGAGYVTSLGGHLCRWLRSENVAATLATPRTMASTLSRERVAFLLGFSNPTPSDLQTLRAFRARGGKLIVFNSASPALGDLMGVRPLGYSVAPYAGAWSRMAFFPKTLPGAPSVVAQTSSALTKAAAIPGRSRVIAVWQNRQGVSTGDAAWLASAGGYWMTQLLLSDGDEREKARLCGALVGALDSRAWSAAASSARASSRAASFRAYAAAQVPRPGEIHAVWEHSGLGLYPGNWARTIQVLKANHVTDLFVNVAGAGFAHYASSVLPRSKVCLQNGDQLSACCAAARGSGIRIHAWILCFTETRAEPAVKSVFLRRGWRLRAAKGQFTDYLDPANTAVRAHLLAAIDELQARPGVSGVHLDFVRWGETVQKPRNASALITSFVTAARTHVRRPKWLTAAVYGRHPQCVGKVGQDWPSWISTGIVDYAVPMDYVEQPAEFASLLASQAAGRGHAARTIVGIGVSANESHLNVRQVIDQAVFARRYGFAGVSLFDLNMTLARETLPYLRLGLW